MNVPAQTDVTAKAEHLCGLGRLPERGFRFFAVPVKAKHFGTFPVRAFGLIPRKPP